VLISIPSNKLGRVVVSAILGEDNRPILGVRLALGAKATKRKRLA
jgi:hypothetical protein